MAEDLGVSIKMPESEGSGVANILRAFMLNPGGALQIIGFLFGMFGLYYALTGSIGEVKAGSEQHYKDLRAESVQATQTMTARLDTVISNDASQTARIEQLYGRSDSRYQAIISKLSDNDVRLAQLSAQMEYIGKSLDNRRDVRIGPPQNQSPSRPYP